MNHRGSMNHGGMVSRGSMDHRGLRVGSSSVIGDVSDVAIDGVGVVVDVLDPAVGKSHGVGALGVTGAVTGLSSVEVGVGVVVSHGVVVGVGGDLVRVNLGSVGDHRGVVGGGSVDNRGMVGGGSVNHRGSMDHRGV